MITTNQLTVLKPTTGHKGDTFRELVEMWGEAGYCNVQPTTSIYCWIEKEGKVLLYDADRYDHLPPSWEVGLFGNPPATNPRSYRWTYFARRPRLLEKTIQAGLPTYAERTILSAFLGKIENMEQGKSRVSVSSDWPQFIELFSCPVLMGDEISYPFTQEQYLQKLAQTKFGLCLPGYGKKCNREVELLGLGTVPLVTPGVDTEHYHEPLREGVHFLRVNRPEEIPGVIAACSRDEWEFLSANGRAWYERNCSREASWKLTMKILDSVGAWA